MNLRLLFCIGMGVFVTYMGVVMLIEQYRTKARWTAPPKPNFAMRQMETVDPETGEKILYREITVSTKLEPVPATPPPERPVLVEPLPEQVTVKQP